MIIQMFELSLKLGLFSFNNLFMILIFYFT